LCAGSANPEEFSEESWAHLIRVALQHGVAPLLYLQTKGLLLPEAVSTQLRRVYHQERASLQAELIGRAGPVIPLKGPQLAVRLYGDPGARQVADLDFLMGPEHLPAADRVLAQRGFSRETAPIARLQRCRDICYSRPLKGAGELCVDLHLRLRPYGRGDVLVARLWQEGMTGENLLLYLCLNLMVHRWARLQPLLDIVALLRRGGLDWSRVEAAARELEWSAGVDHGVRFAAQLAGKDARLADSPSSGGSKFQRWWVERMLGGDADALLERSQWLDGPLGTVSLLGCEKGNLGKLRLAGSILFPAGTALRQMDTAGASLPLPLHYLERAARKTGQAIKASVAARRNR
jgi:hypothetical protein